MSEQFDLRWVLAYVPRRDWHFLRRLQERFGVVLAPGEYAQMVRDIRAGKIPLAGFKRGSPIFRVTFGEVSAYVVVDAECLPITALPLDTRLFNPPLSGHRAKSCEHLPTVMEQRQARVSA